MMNALLLVDLQNDYFPSGRWPLDRIEAAAANAARVLDAARRRGDRIIHIRHEILRKPAPFFSPGTEGAAIHPALTPRVDEEVFTKHFPNAFRETGLAAVLGAPAETALTIVGAMSHFCIDSTTRAASDRGHPVTVIHDACATRGLEFDGVRVPAAHVHAAFMAALASGIAQLATTDAFVQDCFRRAR